MIYGIIIGVLLMASFLMGLKVGIKVRKEEKIEIVPNIPKIINETKKKAEQEKELDRFAQIARNIENYNGTAEGQVKIK